MNLRFRLINDHGLDQAESYALSFWINQKARTEHGLEACMFQTSEALKFIDDVASGRHSFDQSCSASESTWRHIKAASSMHNKETRVANGVDVVKQRYRKQKELDKLRKVALRLQSDYDDCVDIIGSNKSIDVLTKEQQADATLEHFSKMASFSGRLRAMNEYLKYFGPGSFQLLCGGSGSGKTNLALQALENLKTLYIGVDMSLPDVVKRTWEIKAYSTFPPGFEYGYMRDTVSSGWEVAKKDKEKLMEYMRQNLKMVDVSTVTVEEIFNIVQKEIDANCKPDCVVIDYMDKVESEQKFNSEHEKQKFVGRKMKELAKLKGVAVLALVQYNAKAEPFKVGSASWLQGSKDLIAVSDGCICIWRSKTTNDISGQEMPDLSHIWVSNSLKNRSTGYMDDQRIDCVGLYLVDSKQVGPTW